MNNDNMTDEEFLAHYGVLGMKWGKRKMISPTKAINDLRKKKEVKTSQDHKNKEKLKRKRVSEMTNEELRTLTTRLQLERQYNDLTKAKTNKGAKIVTDILMNAAKQSATQYANKYMAEKMQSAFK